MTSLYNRNYYDYVFKKEFKDGYIYYIDINNLKKINDTVGHLKGDVLIKKIAVFLNIIFKGSVIRIGGDEFIGFETDDTNRDFLLNALPDISFGKALKTRVDRLSKVVKLAEQRMYIHKKERNKGI